MKAKDILDLLAPVTDVYAPLTAAQRAFADKVEVERHPAGSCFQATEPDEPVKLTEDQLDDLAILCTLVKILYVVGYIQVLPDLIRLIGR